MKFKLVELPADARISNIFVPNERKLLFHILQTQGRTMGYDIASAKATQLTEDNVNANLEIRLAGIATTKIF
jgi:hypothetical protein